MKHCLLLISFLFSLNCFSQIELKDNISDSGNRVITAPLIIDGNMLQPECWAYMLAGSTMSFKHSPVYVMNVAIKGMTSEQFTGNPGILIRFFDTAERVISLRADYVSYLAAIDSPVAIQVELTETQLRLFKNGVKKIRIETKENYIERNYDEDVWGVDIYEAYKAIKERFEKPRPSFEDGF